MDNINIFVSSTCFDLSQIRTDISEFIKMSGHNPILSEFENFPISPDINTIENCMKIVKENADILVLIVGSRYGSIIENGKSITNNEFLVAKQKGIPIFCFIEKRTLNAFEFWISNKNGDFTSIVDDVKIFEFLDDIRTRSKTWTFPFEKAQDIISTLKIQLSYLFKDSLKIRKSFNEEIPEFFRFKLSDKSLKILFEKKDYYEYLFLSQTLVDEIQKKEFLKNDIEYSLLTEPQHTLLEYKEIPNWANERISSFLNILTSIENIINLALNRFIGGSGVSPDLKGLYYISIRYSELYERVLNWILTTRSANIGEDFEDAKYALAEFAAKPARIIWDFPFDFQRRINTAIQQIKLGEKDFNLEIMLTLEMEEGVQERFNNILNKLRTYYGI